MNALCARGRHGFIDRAGGDIVADSYPSEPIETELEAEMFVRALKFRG